MSMSENTTNLSDLERQVDDQRQRVEQRLHDIQDRLSPGQLLDQALRYTRHGGADFVSSMGNAVTANPVPTALLGVSLAWLMLGPKQPSAAQVSRQHYPYARVSGAGLQRTRHERNEAGEWFSHFADDVGTEYKARADESGQRLGHFVDSTGRKFSGFIDDAGNRIDRFRDEAGNAMDEATNWASHAFHDVGESVSHVADSVSAEASRMGQSLKQGAGDVKHSLTDLLHDQPLVAGALAFAVGAALGAGLPPTEQEDELLGRQSDDLKRDAKKAASKLYDKGKQQVEDVYDEASDAVGSAYDAAKSSVGNAQDRTRAN